MATTSHKQSLKNHIKKEVAPRYVYQRQRKILHLIALGAQPETFVRRSTYDTNLLVYTNFHKHAQTHTYIQLESPGKCYVGIDAQLKKSDDVKEIIKKD